MSIGKVNGILVGDLKNSNNVLTSNAEKFNNVIINDSIGNFERTDSFSVDMWIYPTTARATALIGKSNNVPARRGWYVSCFGSRSTCNQFGVALVSDESANNYINVLTTLGSYPINKWYHVAVTYNGSSVASGIKCYVNSTLLSFAFIVKDNLTDTIKNTGKLWLGRSHIYGYFPGRLDETVIYNRVLSASEITQRYNSGVGTESVFGTTYLQYHLNQSSGSAVVDSSINSRNGLTVGSPSWVAGKLNNCLQLNGTSQYIEV